MKRPLMPIRALLEVLPRNLLSLNRKWDDPLESTRGVVLRSIIGTQNESLAKTDETAYRADSSLARGFAVKPSEPESKVG